MWVMVTVVVVVKRYYERIDIPKTGYQSRQQEGRGEWAEARYEGSRIIEVVSRMR